MFSEKHSYFEIVQAKEMQFSLLTDVVCLFVCLILKEKRSSFRSAFVKISLIRYMLLTMLNIISRITGLDIWYFQSWPHTCDPLLNT